MNNAISKEIERSTGFSCIVVRSDRQSIALQVTTEAKLIIRAPICLPSRFITAFINKKRSWILKKQNQAQEHAQKYSTTVFKAGRVIPYLGEFYTIVLNANAAVRISGKNIVLPQEAPKDKFIFWMKSKALETLKERTTRHSAAMGIKHGTLKISAARTRWGSCSATNNLNFTWRLLLCPPEAIDYVVVHELSHVLHKNHSQVFWTQVAKNCPNYQTQRLWLKNNRRILDIIP